MNVFKKAFHTSLYNVENILMEFDKKKMSISSDCMDITFNFCNSELIYKDEDIYIICIFNEINLIIPIYETNTDFFINLEKYISISKDAIKNID